MALGDSGIRIPEQRGNWASDSVTATEDDSVSAGNGGIRRLQEAHNGGRGTRREQGVRGARGKMSDIISMESRANGQ